ncbi:MAG: DUF2752 domain-containing protein [Bacillota bacterium]|nr:DUF2752 domain-containing protein [Bacillota bacterium]
MNVRIKDSFIWLVICTLFVLFGYYCPIHWIVGIPCPGCNMTTALVCLIKLDIHASLYYHAMCIPTIISFVLFIVFKCYNKQNWLNWVLGGWISLMMVYYLYRMICIFPHDPMLINESALLQNLFNRWRL